MKELTKFTSILESWYDHNGRDLPWRHTKDPYLIWISEIILQQTRIAQGLGYYLRFIERFPDYKSLAEASEDEVLYYWQGLGYYSRARNLHEAAKSIAQIGTFPKDYKSILKLKGVGEYTAAAICSFAYGLPHAVVDGNVYRVLARYFDIDIPIDSTSGKKYFSGLAQELLDNQQPGLYNQAIMDFGALICTPKSPQCQMCPLADSCASRIVGTTEERPTKSHRTLVTDRYFNYIIIRIGKYYLLHKREKNDIWKNLYEVPLIETNNSLNNVIQLFKQDEWKLFNDLFHNNDYEPSFSILKQDVIHVLSHRRIHANFMVLEAEGGDLPAAPNGYFWCQERNLSQYAVSKLISMLFDIFFQNNR